MLKRILAAALAAGTIGTALAAPPDLNLNPPPDADGVPDGGSPSPSFEIVFSGPTKSLIVTPSSGSGAGAGNTTTLVCQPLTGDSQIERLPGVPSFEGSAATPQNVELTCNPGAASRTALLTCNEKKGAGAPTIHRWDISCPVGGDPEFGSTPIAGSVLPVQTTPGVVDDATITVSNVGAAPLSITSITGLTPPLSVSPPAAVIGIGETQGFTVSCSSAVPGTFSQNLVVNSNDADEAAVNFGVDCMVLASEFSANTAPGSTLPVLNAAQGAAAPATTVQITNQGTAPLTLGTITGLVAPLGAQFDSSTVAPGATATLTVGCATDTAQSTGPQVLSFTTNDPDDGEGTITYGALCTITPPTSPEFEPSPAPGSLAPITTTQGTNATRTVTINNIGDAPLNLGAIAGQTATITAAFAPPGPVGIGGMTTLTITCNAAAAGTFGPASLGFTTDDPDEGEGAIGYSVACEVAAPASPEFSSAPAAPGPVSIVTNQGVNDSETLTVTNIGSASLQITGITGPAGPKISLMPPGAFPIAIAPMALLVLTLNCDASSAAGSPFNDSITLATNDTSGEASVGFTVTCAVTAPPPADLEATPAPPGPVGITFIEGGIVPEVEKINFRNVGSSTLQILSVSGLTAPFAATGLPLSIPPGADASISIECASLMPGFYTDTFTVDTNDPDEGALVYNATCRVLSNQPEFDSFPVANSVIPIDTIAGESGAAFLFLSNLGAQPLRVNASLLAPTVPPTPLSISFAETTIAPGFGATLGISCSPAAEGSYTGTVRLTHDDAGESPANYDISCFARPDTRAAFRVLISGGVFTAGKTEIVLRNGFE